MATTPTYINQRINNLQSQINDIISGGGGGVPSSSVLAVILANGNSAGTNGIDMNDNSITSINTLQLPDTGSGFSADITTNNITFTDTASSETSTLTANSLTFSNAVDETNISNTGGYDLTLLSSNQLILSSSDNLKCNVGSGFTVSASDYIIMTAVNDGIDITADDNISLISAGLGDIVLNAPNINSYGWAMPICLNAFFEGGLFYTLNSQAIENVLVSNPLPIITLPPQFFSDTPQTGYISTRWQINFDMNIYHGSNLDDKGFAIYLLFVDGLGNIYTPFLYNSNTPFCRYALGAGYGGGGAPPYMSINWCDYVDFNQMVGTGNSDITIQMWVAGDDPISGDFRMKLGFTRINRL